MKFFISVKSRKGFKFNFDLLCSLYCVVKGFSGFDFGFRHNVKGVMKSTCVYLQVFYKNRWLGFGITLSFIHVVDFIFKSIGVPVLSDLFSNFVYLRFSKTFQWCFCNFFHMLATKKMNVFDVVLLVAFRK